MAKLVKASQGYAQIVYFKYNQTITLLVDGDATPIAKNTTAFSTDAVMIQSNVDVHFRVSDANNSDEVTANDPIAWARTDRFVGIKPGQVVSVMKVNSEPNGTVRVTPLQEV